MLGLAVMVVGWRLTASTAPCSDFHWGAQFSGSNRRLQYWIGGCGNDLGEARGTLAADCVLIVGYAFAARERAASMVATVRGAAAEAAVSDSSSPCRRSSAHSIWWRTR